MRSLMIAGAALALAGCAGGGSAPGPSYGDPYYWDYGFRYGVYDYHYGDDDYVARPDRPDRPGVGDPRPTHPIAAPPRAATMPAGGFGRGTGARGGGRGGGRR